MRLPLPQRPNERLPTSPKLQDQWLDWLQYSADLAYWAVPRAKPTLAQVQAGKLIAHRGAHSRYGLRENTMAAFRRAGELGAWGIELDVRWTRDKLPVVIHDADTERAFGLPLTVAEVDFAELRRKVPDVPLLQEVVDEFGGKLHLMLETKSEPWRDRAVQFAALRDILAGLNPGDDYHWMGIDINFLRDFDLVGVEHRIPITFFSVQAFGNIVLNEGFAGLGGHYLLLNNRLWRKFRRAGKQFGVGFPASENALRREMRRDIQWIFTNDIERLGPVRQRLLAELKPQA